MKIAARIIYIIIFITNKYFLPGILTRAETEKPEIIVTRLPRIPQKLT